MNHSKGNPSPGRVLFTVTTILLIAGLFGGFLGAISGDLL